MRVDMCSDLWDYICYSSPSVCYLFLPSSDNKHIIKHFFFFFSSNINKPVIVSDDYKHFMLVIISNNHNSYK